MLKTKWMFGLAVLIGLGLASCNPGTTSTSTTSEGGDEESTSETEPDVGGEGTTSETTPDEEDKDQIEHYTRTFEILDGEGKAFAKPDYVDLRIISSLGNWTDVLDDSNLLIPVEGEEGHYSFDFGTVTKGTVVAYKIVATTMDSVSVWGFEGAYAGELDEGNNPFFTIESEADPVVTGWSFTSLPSDPALVKGSINFTVTLSDFAAGADYDGLVVRGSFNGWAVDLRMDQDPVDLTKFSYTLEDVAQGTYEFQFATVLGTERINYIGDANNGGKNLNVTIDTDHLDLDLNFVGTVLGGVTLDAGEPPVPVEEIENYTREFVIANVPEGMKIYIVGALGEGKEWVADMATAERLAKVDGKADTYSYNFGTKKVGDVIQYKLVASLLEEGSVWDKAIAFEGTFAGDMVNNNPVLTVSTENDPAITEWSWATWPTATINLTINVTITDLVLPEGSGLYAHGNFTDPNWSSYLMEAGDEANEYTVTMKVQTNKEADFGFAVKDIDTGAQSAWIHDGTANLHIEWAEAAIAFSYTGTTAGVSLVA